MRLLRTALLPLLAALAVAGAPAALAGGGDYVFDGGSGAHREQVRAALEASAFDWDLVPARITIHVARGAGSYATPGHVWLDADLLDAGRLAWAVVQDEYAHQLDFLVLDAAMRERLRRELGAPAWCYESPLAPRHAQQGCERFASTLVWAYWPSRDNAYRPTSAQDESAAMEPARFRALLGELIGAPTQLASARTLASARPKPRARPAVRR